MNVTQNDTAPLTVAQAARRMGELGYKVVPIGRGAKYPKIKRWQDKATDDAATIEAWFADADADGTGLGWAMGAQPIGGEHVFCVDVDSHDVDGMANLIALISEHGGNVEFVNTTAQNTGNNGAHFVFTAPFEVRNSASQIAPGIDIRGEGGQIIVAPTTHPDTGNPYVWSKPPWQTPPMRAPEWLLDAIRGIGGGGETDPPEAALNTKPVSHASDDGVNPADWLRDHWDWSAELATDGWTLDHVLGDHEYWKRPGKTDKGHSAVVHRSDNVLVCFSTETPQPLMDIGRPTADGSGVSVSPFQYETAMRHGGDMSAAASTIRRRMPSRFTGERYTPVPADIIETGDTPIRADEALPDEWWSERELFGHIRQAARARLVSPDALLVNIMGRYAATIHPTIKLPAIIGSSGTFDFMGCVVANSSGGKTIASSVARELFPVDMKKVLMDLPVGSGEGLIQSFLVDEEDDEGKPTGRQVVGIDAVHMNVDEGTALTELSSRTGTTILQTLCSGWSGAALGQANASKETRRIIAPGRVRVSALINIQGTNAHHILSERLTSVGFPQRVIWATAHDRLFDGDHHEWPGVLDLPRHHILTGQERVLTCEQSIEDELRGTRQQVLRGTLSLGPLEGHAGLQQLKISGILALMDNRTHITEHDWYLARALMDSSRALRQRLQDIELMARAEAVQANTEHRTAAASARVTLSDRGFTSDEVTLVTAAAGAFRLILSQADGPLTPRNISLLASSKYRNAKLRDAALDLLLHDGDIAVLPGGEVSLTAIGIRTLRRETGGSAGSRQGWN